MPIQTKQKKLYEDSLGGAPTTKTFSSDVIAIGTVVDTNDPMQWGRIRIVVTGWGDSWEHNVADMPWAMYVSPFGGQTSVGTRGAGIKQTEGGIAYGMWAIPAVGAHVVVMSLDEGHQQRLYMGCIFDPYITHTLPHGRWMYEDHPELKDKPKSKPYGPFSSRERPIQPLSDNLRQSFGDADGSYEWRTRAADYMVSRLDVSQLNNSVSKVQDDKGTDSGDGWVSTQGYQASRINPSISTGTTDKNYDSHVYSITSPGFHSMSMDDRMENCRMRFRTMSGHQILLDDTNERIYISTAKGNNWVEMDQAGNIDVFTTNTVSIRAAQDINLTADKSIRMHAGEGIHMHSNTEIRMNAKTDTHIKTQENIKMEAGKNINIKSGADLKLYSSGNTNVKSGGKIHLNGSAKTADSADAAFFTNRVPAHEPWARTKTKEDTGHAPEFDYNDKNVGKMEKGTKIPRGLYWRR